MSRFRIIALLAALVALTTAFAACGGGGSDDPQQRSSTTLRWKGSKAATSTSRSRSSPKERKAATSTSRSPARSRARTPRSLPELAIAATASGKAEGEDIDFEGGLTLLSDRAFVSYEGTDYEVDPTTFGLVKSSFEQAQNQGGEGNAADVTACQEAAEGMDVGDFFDDLTSEGSADVDGTSTTKVSGDLNPGAAAEAIIELAEDPACSSQLEAAGGLPIEELEEAKAEVTSAIKKAHADVYVGDDDIVRRVVAELTIEPKDTKGEKVELDFELTLSGVNEQQEISAPQRREADRGAVPGARRQPDRTARSPQHRRGPRRPARRAGGRGSLRGRRRIVRWLGFGRRKRGRPAGLPRMPQGRADLSRPAAVRGHDPVNGEPSPAARRRVPPHAPRLAVPAGAADPGRRSRSSSRTPRRRSSSPPRRWGSSPRRR